MDTFVEQLVVRKNNAKHIAKLIIYLLLIFSAPALFVLLGNIWNRYFIIVAVCAFLFGVYGSYYLVTGLYVEYEYAVTNSNITIDKITAKRSRKRIISVDIKKFNTLRKLSDADLAGKNYKKFFKASVTEDGDDVYAAEMHLDKFRGDCLLLFSPDEKTINAMKPYFRTNVKADLIKSGVISTAKKEHKSAAKSDNKASAKPEKKSEAEKKDNKSKKNGSKTNKSKKSDSSEKD